MAHSVRESPISAFCSSWVVEYAILHALSEAGVDTTRQAEREQRWQQRCRSQIEQLGICRVMETDSMDKVKYTQDKDFFIVSHEPELAALHAKFWRIAPVEA